MHTTICCCSHCLNTGNRCLSKPQRLIYPQNMSRIVILHRNNVAFSANSAFLFLLQHYLYCSCLPHKPSFQRTWKHGMKTLRREIEMHRPQDTRISSSILSIACSKVSKRLATKRQTTLFSLAYSLNKALLFVNHTGIQWGKDTLRQK